MTTVILVIIGIVLAAAAALMLVFYGGDAFYSSRIDAEASRLTVEGAQMQRAVSAFEVQEGRRPGGGSSSAQAGQDLIDYRYMVEIPKGANHEWVVDYDNKLIRSDLGSSSDAYARQVCIAARRQQNLPYPGQIFLCDGSDYPGGNGSLPQKETCCVFNDNGGGGGLDDDDEGPVVIG